MARNNSNNAGSKKSNRRRSSGGRARKQSRGGQQPMIQAGGSGQSRRGGMQSMGSRAISMVSDHPIPAAMIGAGLAMLLLENRSGLANVERKLMSQGRELLGGVGESLSEYTSGAREMLGSFDPRSSRIGEYLTDGASSLGQGVESAYEYGRDALADAWERHPVALCASILAAGVAAGLLLPATRRENSLFGRASDAVARKVREQGRELMSQGRELANDLASDATQTVMQGVGALGLGSDAASSRRTGSNSKSNRNRRSRRSND